MKRFQIVAILFFGLGLVLFGTAQTRLQIARQGTNVVVSWPANNATFSVLQRTPTLAPSNWTRVPEIFVSSTGTFYTVTAPSNAASFFRLVIDEPDDAFTDLDGDGIDGTASMAVFVSTTGSDSNPGTMSQPVQSIARGIMNAMAQGRKHVYIAKGEYLSRTISMVDGISLFGGYDAADWSRSTSNIVQLHVTDPTALVVNNVTNATALDRLEIRGGDAASVSGSAYGIFVRNSPGLVVHNSIVQAGNARAGSDGSNGANGSNGNDGFPGSPGCENSSGFCSNCNQPQGGAGGTSACGRTGGRGGLPGQGASFGSAGLVGAGGTPGGPGTPPGAGNWNTPSTYWGANGTNGGSGVNGAAGNFTLLAGGYIPSAGAIGGAGIPGNGGGGGGGGGGGDDACDSYGGAGGGGGAGACPGLPGTGGASGGASIAVYLWSSNIKLENCSLISGSGGNGGRGGTGGTGGTGGLGGRNSSLSGAGNPYSGSGEQDDGSNGGRGGDGGNGGRGGHGGGGAGGPSIAVARGGGSAPQISSVSYTLGTGGVGGSSLGNAGPQGQAFNVFP